jgi:hypothetical protein
MTTRESPVSSTNDCGNRSSRWRWQFTIRAIRTSLCQPLTLKVQGWCRQKQIKFEALEVMDRVSNSTQLLIPKNTQCRNKTIPVRSLIQPDSKCWTKDSKQEATHKGESNCRAAPRFNKTRFKTFKLFSIKTVSRGHPTKVSRLTGFKTITLALEFQAKR